MSSPVAGFAANLAQTILGSVADARTEPFAVGVVTAVDASSNATVAWKGTEAVVKRNRLYTPVVGDVVLMVRPQDQLVIAFPIA